MLVIALHQLHILRIDSLESRLPLDSLDRVDEIDLPDEKQDLALLALHPNVASIRSLKAYALEILAQNLITATGRNYYLTVAQELRKPVPK